METGYFVCQSLDILLHNYQYQVVKRSIYMKMLKNYLRLFENLGICIWVF